MGFYGRGNFGDDLMCVSLADYLSRVDDAPVVVASSDVHAYADLERKGITIVPRHWKSLWSILSQTRVLCQGGGTHFHDSYQGKHLPGHWLNLAKWGAVFWIARLKGVRVVLLGVGVGPLRHLLSRLITRIALAACSAIGVRDEASCLELKRIGSNIPLALGFDLAALSFSSSPRVSNCESSTRVLGISACSLTPFLGDAELNRQYWRIMGEALAAFTQANRIQLEFFSLFTGDSSESDDTVVDLIVSQLGPGATYRRHRYNGERDHFTELFQGCDWFIATKFHAAISAYLAGCECAIVSYNRKMIDLANEMHLPQERCVDAGNLQPTATWLRLFESLSRRQTSASLLDRAEAQRRAQQAVEQVIECPQSKQSAQRVLSVGG